MRATGAFLIVIGTLALGFTALSMQAQSVKDTAVTNGTNASAAAYNTTTGALETIGQTITPALLYGGIAVLAFLSIGLVYVYANQGR